MELGSYFIFTPPLVGNTILFNTPALDVSMPATLLFAQLSLFKL